MATTSEEFLASLSRFSVDQVRQAGQRYTPGVDPRAPNLRIASLFTAIENVACGPGAQVRFQSFVEELSEAWGRAAHCSQRRDTIQAQIDEVRAAVATAMPRLRARDATTADQWIGRLSAIEETFQSDMTHWRNEEAKLPPAQREQSYSSERNAIQGNQNSIGRCLRIVEEEKEYSGSPAFKVLADPFLLVTGEWGTGKTHLLCDVTQDRIRRGQATVLILAKNFLGRVIEDVCGRIESGITPDGLFDQLQQAADRLGERAVVVVEGVNEGRRHEWRVAISALCSLIADRPGVALIVTCRTPFEAVAIADKDRGRFHEVQHRGFDDQEFDAQAAFFQYYELPLPEVPLLDREFSRPLTLKLICQSLKNLTGRKLAEGFAGIASGQKGMTFVLESFVNRVGEPIEKEYGLAPKGCWWLLKGSNRIADRRLAGFAPCMAAFRRSYVRPTEADRIVAANYPALTRARRRELLESMRTNGLMEEDVIWYRWREQIKSRIVYRLPYQRFSDHLIARHLLEAYLDVSTAAAIKRSFLHGSRLGRIFMRSRLHGGQYAEPGWVQALITEFPVRAGSRVPSNRRELFFALPKSARNLSAYFEPFIEGLFWRDPASFTEGTRRVINQYLNSNAYAWKKVVDALAAVSTKPKHPYHARRLYNYIARFPMRTRDTMWSEYLRRKYDSPTIHRLLTWAQKLDVAGMTERVANELVVLLSLVLTTVVRSDRDLVTKALVLIGERFPEIIFKHALTTLRFNDPYVSERVLAAAYGVTMSLVDSDTAMTFRPLLGGLASDLYRNMFAPRARHATSHCLIRDYALGIIELAQRVNCFRLSKAAGRNLSVPYPQIGSIFSGTEAAPPAVTDAIGDAIQMDFGNYTIGRLIPHRANYDNKNSEYVRVRGQIEQRIYDLGYRKKQFESIDREIGSMSPRAQDDYKVDRYGKKYSWIAYFEMWGEREARKLLPDRRLRERTSDCGVDPSFPKRPPAWNPPIPDLFGDLTTSTEEWAAGGFTPRWDSLLAVPDINAHPGPWVMLEGFVRGEDQAHDRELFAFLRGAFVSQKDIRRLRTKFMAIDYPGNSELPDGASESYLYAGEAGRRGCYARHLLMPNGTYRRQIDEAFDRRVTIKSAPQRLVPKIEIKLLSPNGEERDSLVRFFGPVPRTRRIPGVRLELPAISFGWESYHSAQNEFSGFDLPAPSLIQRLGLASRNREVDFYDDSGAPGIVYREAGSSWKGNRHSFLYIRADLIRRYLAQTRQKLVWCNWGERDWLTKMDRYEVRANPARQRIFEGHKHIHRSFAEWSG
jgi:hypothetical protein